MTSNGNTTVNLYESGSVSREGFRIENAASVAREYCLNEWVHPNRL
jgi:hypothetical protein